MRRSDAAVRRVGPCDRLAGTLADAVAARAAVPRGLVQRTPTAWRDHETTATVAQLARGNAWTSYWPPVQDHVAAYGRLQAADLDARTRKLDELAVAVAAWRANQAKRSKNALARSKETALSALDDLIGIERAEIEHGRERLRAPAPPLRVGSSPLSIVAPVDAEAPRLELAPPPLALLPLLPPAPAPRRPITGTLAGGVAPPRREIAVKDFELGPSRHEPRVPKLPGNLYFTVHFTKPERVASIHDEGLVAGKEAGIGLPALSEKGPRPDRDRLAVYVVDPKVRAEEGRGMSTISAVSSEAGGGVVVVVASRRGDPDENYKPLGSAMKYPAAPPVRGVDADNAVYSFTLPMTPRTEGGLTRFVNRVGAGRDLPQRTVVELVDSELRDVLGVHYPRVF
jgi:hypothetical protein